MLSLRRLMRLLTKRHQVCLRLFQPLLAVASEADIAKHISKLGLYRNKAKFLQNVQAIAG